MAIASDLDRFRAYLLEQDAACDALAGLVAEDAFCAAAVALAGDVGIALDRAALAAAIRPDPLGIERFVPTAATARAWPGAAWLPVDIVAGTREPLVVWAHFAGVALGEPFFEMSRRRAVARPLNRLLRWRTPLATLAATMPSDVRMPDGLVYHLSRCGSTLVAQMIAALPHARMVSEAPAIDAVVQLVQMRADLPEAWRIALLRAIVMAYGRGVGGPFALKLDSWHAIALPLLRAAFPGVPWVFLFREPVEILVSQARQRGVQTVAGALPDAVFDIAGGETLSSTDYGARVLARVCDAVLAEDGAGGGAGGLLIDYADLPGAVERDILPHFGIVPDAAGAAALRAASRRDAKAPGETFTDDRAAKQREADAPIRAAAQHHLAARHARLKQRSVRRATALSSDTMRKV